MSASRRKNRIVAFQPIPGSRTGLLRFDPAGLLQNESDIAIYLSEALMDDTVPGILRSFFTACRAPAPKGREGRGQGAAKVGVRTGPEVSSVSCHAIAELKHQAGLRRRSPAAFRWHACCG